MSILDSILKSSAKGVSKSKMDFCWEIHARSHLLLNIPYIGIFAKYFKAGTRFWAIFYCVEEGAAFCVDVFLTEKRTWPVKQVV